MTEEKLINTIKAQNELIKLLIDEYFKNVRFLTEEQRVNIYDKLKTLKMFDVDVEE